MPEPSTVAFEYGSPSQPSLKDIVMAAEAQVPGTSWIAAVCEPADTGTVGPPDLTRTEWPTLSSKELVQRLSDCPPIVEADFEGYGEFRNACWMTIRIGDGNVLTVGSAQHDFIRHLREKFVPLDDQE